MTDGPAAPEGHDEDATREMAVVVSPPASTAVVLFGTDDPVGIVQRTTSIANALADAIKQQGMSTKIQGREYVLAEGWAFLGAMFGVFPNVISVVPVDCSEHQGCGFEARVELHSRDGSVVGGAIAECSSHEEQWAQRDNHALKSMAQTRATGKAYRMSFGFVMKSAGYEATPAEEMGEVKNVKVRSTTPPRRRESQSPAAAARPPQAVEPQQEGWGDIPQFTNVGGFLNWALDFFGLTADDTLRVLERATIDELKEMGLQEAGAVLVERGRDAQREPE